MGGVASQRQQAPDIDLPTDFSLERALRHASNPALTAVRYHDSRTAHGRKLADDFERPAVDEVLGKGTYFEVVSIRGRATGRRYALKTFSKKTTPEDLLGLMTSELEIFTGLDHPHIARAEGVYETEEDIYLVMECCEGGELFDRLAAQGPLTEADAADAIRQILRAVGYLHARGVALFRSS